MHQSTPACYLKAELGLSGLTGVGAALLEKYTALVLSVFFCDDFFDESNILRYVRLSRSPETQNLLMEW